MNSFCRKTLLFCFLCGFFAACGSSANLAGNSNATPGGSGVATTPPTLTSEDSATANLANLPEISNPEDQVVIFDCTAKDGDPAVDYVTVTCASDTTSTVYLYYCVGGVVTREIEDSSEDSVTLYSETNVECENIDGTPTLTETELIVS